jgi:uncharacterized membrane protein (DUF2068 family)
MGVENRDGEKRSPWITAIGIGKLLKAVVLVAVGVAALTMMSEAGARTLHHEVERAGLSPGSHLLHKAFEKAAGLDERHLAAVGIGTFVYAASFSVEGIGLLLRKRWAEYLTIILTGSFIPLEVYETIRHVTALRIAGIVLNVAAVVYLVWHLISKRSASQGTPHPAHTD